MEKASARIRTSDGHVAEVLIGACFVIARATSSFVLAHGLLKVNLMAKGCRQEAT
jgi:hypothetical protein